MYGLADFKNCMEMEIEWMEMEMLALNPWPILTGPGGKDRLTTRKSR